MADKKYKLSFGMSDGSTKEAAFSVPVFAVRPQDYGAKGDGATDDTAAFQSALAANRVVHVPGGTYKLSGELTIGNNCCMELSQDTVLKFTQTSGNCISMKMSASIKGNHATINVPYTFSGNAIYVSTTLNDNVLEIPPWAKWTPQWKTGRYITDLNITKANSNGFHYSDDGTCYGTAVYISADNSGTVETRSTFIWGLNFSGLRIAGGFSYGIRAQNFNNAWNHEMRIEAFIDACKIGVSLEHCNNAYISASIQPRKAANEKPYAVHGIKLDSCENTDLLGSRVWDWNAENSLWSYDKNNVNQHIAMYGNCKGTIVNDYLYHYLPSGVSDIRELIYCEPAYRDINLSTLVVLQEPITRWFKPIDNEPYFNNGIDGNQRLSLKEEVDAYFDAAYVPKFTDVLASASDGAGGVFNGIGYKQGSLWATDGKTLVDDNWVTCTGYIPCAAGDTIYVDGMSVSEKASDSDDYRVILFNANYEKVIHVNQGNLVTNASYYNIDSYSETENGFSFRIVNDAAAYLKMNVIRSSVSTKPAVSRNEPISYTQSGFLADGIKVKGENVIGLPSGGSGEKGERGNSILNITTAPSSYATATGGFTPTYRISLSSVLSQAKVDKVLVGDTLRYSYYVYPVGYVDASYVYCGTRVSIRGATGAAGTSVTIESITESPDDGGINTVLFSDGNSLNIKNGSAGSGGSGGAQPNWNAAPGEPGHVLYRTHYIEIVEMEFLPQTTGVPGQEMGLDGFALVGTMRSLAPGTAYKVTYNGVNYTCIAFQLPPEMNNLIAMGNMSVVGGANTGEPFVFAQYPAEYQQATGKCAFIIPLDGATSVTVSIFGESEIVHELDSKYMPGGVPYLDMKPYSFPETEAIPTEGGLFPVMSKMELTEGNTYTVTYNGVDYVTECVYIDNENTGLKGLCLGNTSFFGNPDTGEPFMILAFSTPQDGAWGFVVPADGSTSVTFSIAGENGKVRKLDERLLPDSLKSTLVFTGKDEHGEEHTWIIYGAEEINDD